MASQVAAEKQVVQWFQPHSTFKKESWVSFRLPQEKKKLIYVGSNNLKEETKHYCTSDHPMPEFIYLQRKAH